MLVSYGGAADESCSHECAVYPFVQGDIRSSLESQLAQFRAVAADRSGGMANDGAAAGVAIALAVVCFALRGKGHPEPLD